MSNNWKSKNAITLPELDREVIIKFGNPYYEKPKRGRPTKEMKEKRKLAEKWDIDNLQERIGVNFEQMVKDGILYKHEEKGF